MDIYAEKVSAVLRWTLGDFQVINLKYLEYMESPFLLAAEFLCCRRRVGICYYCCLSSTACCRHRIRDEEHHA